METVLGLTPKESVTLAVDKATVRKHVSIGVVEWLAIKGCQAEVRKGMARSFVQLHNNELRGLDTLSLTANSLFKWIW